MSKSLLGKVRVETLLYLLCDSHVHSVQHSAVSQNSDLRRGCN